MIFLFSGYCHLTSWTPYQMGHLVIYLYLEDCKFRLYTYIIDPFLIWTLLHVWAGVALVFAILTFMRNYWQNTVNYGCNTFRLLSVQRLRWKIMYSKCLGISSNYHIIKVFLQNFFYKILICLYLICYRDFQSDYLRCDCHLQWIIKWSKDKKVKVKSTTTCAVPKELKGQPLKKLKKKDLHCG